MGPGVARMPWQECSHRLSRGARQGPASRVRREGGKESLALGGMSNGLWMELTGEPRMPGRRPCRLCGLQRSARAYTIAMRSHQARLADK